MTSSLASLEDYATTSPLAHHHRVLLLYRVNANQVSKENPVHEIPKSDEKDSKAAAPAARDIGIEPTYGLVRTSTLTSSICRLISVKRPSLSFGCWTLSFFASAPS